MKNKTTLLVVGTDEAGYGPNLGPLLLGSSCWKMTLSEDADRLREAFLPPEPEAIPDDAQKTKRKTKKKTRSLGPTLFDLEETATRGEYDREFTTRAMAQLNAALAPISSRDGLFPLVDSKKLYASGRLAPLERSFLLAAALVDRQSADKPSFRSLLARFARESVEAPAPPWEKDYDAVLPLDKNTWAKEDRIETLREIEKRLADEEIQLREISARRIHPSEFNAAIDRLGLKSGLIADATLAAVAETLARAVEREPQNELPVLALALCDKLGGRDRYLPTLAQRFPDAVIRVVKETRGVSVYRLIAQCGKDRGGRVLSYRSPIALEIRFTAKGEANVPTALASICAKYIREISMEAFNAYWRGQLGSALKPTAGYPLDAKRFRADVEEKRRELGIPDEIFWRKK